MKIHVDFFGNIHSEQESFCTACYYPHKEAGITCHKECMLLSGPCLSGNIGFLISGAINQLQAIILVAVLLLSLALRKKATIHQVSTVLATSKNVLFPGHNHLLATSTDDPSLLDGIQAIIKVSGYQHQWLAGGYNLEIGHF